jgi:hypothetical protein
MTICTGTTTALSPQLYQLRARAEAFRAAVRKRQMLDIGVRSGHGELLARANTGVAQ